MTGRGAPAMALNQNRYKPVVLKSLLASTVVATLFSIQTVDAQTIIIGGGNSQPVIVNQSQMYVLQPRRSPLAGPLYQTAPVQAPQGDFSKGARIVYGNEVIQLVPPGSKPKRKVASKPKPAPKKVVKKPTAPKAVAVKKVEPPKAPEKKVVAAPKPQAPAPVKKVAEAPKPVVKKVEAPKPAETPAAPKVAETPAPKKVMPEKKEVQVAAVDPKKVETPVTTSKKIPEIKTDAPAALKQIFFQPDETKLPGGADNDLREIAAQVKDTNNRIQLVAYAEASSNGTARRLSLGRALVIRSKLMEIGVPNNKIEVRALGKPTDGSPADRVDLKLVAR